MSNSIGSEDRRPRRTPGEERTAGEQRAAETSPSQLGRPEPGTEPGTEATPVYDATQARGTGGGAVPGGSAADTDTRTLDTRDTDLRNRDARDRNLGEPSAEREYTPEARTADVPHTDPGLATREIAVAREKEAFGGVKVGSAFFGWLAATGMAVLLTALVAAAGTAVGLATNTDVNAAVGQAASDQTVGIVGIIVLLVILFVSYYSGGYVAGRMARFNGAKQGIMVWVWALIAAVVVAVLGLIAGERFNILARLNSFPRIPVNEGQLTTTGIIAAVVVAAVALVGAVLGGLAGMHFHRKVDRAGFTPTVEHEER
jgi:hypothetical protein